MYSDPPRGQTAHSEFYTKHFNTDPRECNVVARVADGSRRTSPAPASALELPDLDDLDISIPVSRDDSDAASVASSMSSVISAPGGESCANSSNATT